MNGAVPMRPHEADWWDGDETLWFNYLAISPQRRVVLKDGDEMHLTTKEFDLLVFLASHPGEAFTREGLMHKVWDYTTPVGCSTVTVHIRRLRKKVEDYPGKPTCIRTVWGIGYKFEP